MTLADRIKEDFGHRDWTRGEEYYRAGVVKFRRQDSVSIDATVQGTAKQPYAVHLNWSEANYDTLLVHCTCPRFAETECCKHLAATIIAASAAGVKVPGKRQLGLEALALKSGLDDEDDDEEENDFIDLDARELPPPQHAAGAMLSQRSDVRAAGQQSVGWNWKQRLTEWGSKHATPEQARLAFGLETKPRQIWYELDLPRSQTRGLPTISLHQRVLKKDGTPGKLKAARLSRDEVEELTAEEDRTLLGVLIGNEFAQDYDFDDDGYNPGHGYSDISTCSISPAMFEIILPRLGASGRFGWLPFDARQAENFRPLAWDDGPPWTAKLRVANNSEQQQWEITGRLIRGEETLDINSALLLLAHGLVIFPDHIARFDPRPDFRWPAMLRQGPLIVPVKQEQDFLESVATRLPPPSDAEWPAELRWNEVQATPQPQLKVARPKRSWQSDLECHVLFQYGERVVPFGDKQPAWYDRETRSLLRRDVALEEAACDQLLAAGVQSRPYYEHEHTTPFFLSPRKLPHVVAHLAAAGWQVEAEGQRIRQAGAFSINVHSSVDWFDLEGTCDFGGVTAGLPDLLAAFKRGDQYVVLSDGSQGILPEQWLARYAPLAELGNIADDHLRFAPSQAALLDALLAAQDHTSVHVDKAFAKLRDRLHSFSGIRPRKEPRSFVGELRPYQREGLGWLSFLDDFAFGGCLADDMGLGKTIQVLAWLETRRTSRTGKKPAGGNPNAASGGPATSLVVAPRSLVFNWVEEARRFTPKLRVLNYTGLDRAVQRERFSEFDLVVTTYGTVRQDITDLWKFEFDYAILDEAQAIKNATSQASKACRLLHARRRLAMSGTPIENHLGELWALFEFLNPGMLGRNSKLHDLFSPGRRSRIALSAVQSDDEQRAGLAVLSKALRPFMLRRTKEQVLTELPPKTEQTLYCELDRSERKQYDDLREHYRQALSVRIEKQGINKSKVHVLEALLRLRQAACHPGLLDATKAKSSSSKIETLLEQLEEVIGGGHKALVFSQFTSLLAIVRHQLDQRKVIYEYLDGKTTKRQEKVERFQTDPACPLFLISLKAGGLGLNLTAADYIFILDPWWNPAVEAQAVDRAHRMGQERNVFAYRLIARNTIEEKILQLQEHKRGLADAIISAEGSLLQSLTVEDLQILLS